MTTPRPRYHRPPRIIRTVDALAAYLDHSTGWLSARIDRWENALGFPRRDDELDGWDSVAVDLWIDGRSKLLAPSERLAHERGLLDQEFGLDNGPRALPRNQAA